MRTISSQIAYVGCGQGVALVPSSMRKLAPGNVVVRPLTERVMVVAATLAWNPKRYNPMVSEAIACLKALEARPTKTRTVPVAKPGLRRSA